MKPLLTVTAALLLAAPALAESRSVLVVAVNEKDTGTRVTIYSDDEKDRRTAVTVDEAAKAIGEMKGWGSVVDVSIMTARTLPKNDRKALFDAVDGNAWLDLAYYGPDVRKHLAEHFLKRVHAPELGGDDSPAAVVAAGKRGAATAAADLKAGRPVILYYGKPWSGGKPLVDDATGLTVEVVGGCGVTPAFVAEVDAYNAAVRAWHAEKRKK